MVGIRLGVWAGSSQSEADESPFTYWRTRSRGLYKGGAETMEEEMEREQDEDSTGEVKRLHDEEYKGEGEKVED